MWALFWFQNLKNSPVLFPKPDLHQFLPKIFYIQETKFQQFKKLRQIEK